MKKMKELSSHVLFPYSLIFNTKCVRASKISRPFPPVWALQMFWHLAWNYWSDLSLLHLLWLPGSTGSSQAPPKPYFKRSGENKTKQQQKQLVLLQQTRKSWPWFISEKEIFWDSQLTCCLCNFTSLRSCSTSIFSFSFSGKSSMCRAGIFAPELGPGAAVEVERLEMERTRARPKITAVPAHPARGRRMGPPPRGGPQRPERSAASGPAP